MPRIRPITPSEAQGKLKELYGGIEKKMGKVLNIFQNMGNSAITLQGFLNLSEAANQTSLSPQLREQISLAVGEVNRCEYCLSAHTALAKKAGMQEDVIARARHGESLDQKENAILHFAKSMVEKRGQVTDQEVASLKKAGVSDGELVDIILVVMVNLFTNYFNLITNPTIDFPSVIPFSETTASL